MWEKKGDKWILKHSSTYDGWEWALWYSEDNGPDDDTCSSAEQCWSKHGDPQLMIGINPAKINGLAMNVKKQENLFWNLLKKIIIIIEYILKLDIFNKTRNNYLAAIIRRLSCILRSNINSIRNESKQLIYILHFIFFRGSFKSESGNFLKRLIHISTIFS